MTSTPLTASFLKHNLFARSKHCAIKAGAAQAARRKKVSILAEGMGPLRSKSVDVMRSPSLSQAKSMP